MYLGFPGGRSTFQTKGTPSLQKGTFGGRGVDTWETIAGRRGLILEGGASRNAMTLIDLLKGGLFLRRDVTKKWTCEKDEHEGGGGRKNATKGFFQR